MERRVKRKVSTATQHVPGRRISMMTFNMWKGEDKEPAMWPGRKHVIVQMLRHFRPDVLCVQEGHPILQATVLEALPEHHYITPDIDGHPSWAGESNIFWHAGLFHRADSGAVDAEISETRRVHWVKLRLNSAADVSSTKDIPSLDPAVDVAHRAFEFFVATAHFPWVGGAAEIEMGHNPRVPLSKRVVKVLNDVVASSCGMSDVDSDSGSISASAATPTFPIPLFFMGDLNDDYHPTRILRGAGYQVHLF